MAIKIEDLQALLIQAGVGQAERSKAIKLAEELEQGKKDDRESSGPKAKQKYTILLRSNNPELAKEVADGWIVQTPQDQDDNELLARIKGGTREHNENIKRQKLKITTYAEFFRFVKRAFTKPSQVGIMIKTKEPVRVVIIPTENI